MHPKSALVQHKHSPLVTLQIMEESKRSQQPSGEMHWSTDGHPNRRYQRPHKARDGRESQVMEGHCQDMIEILLLPPASWLL